jgi:dihydrodipicolinate synthase/N-acetylneuraminate lyase
MTYNNPLDYKIEITIPMFEELLKIDTIEATKESTIDVTNVTIMRNAFGNDIKILCGVDTLALEELVLGADGWFGGCISS